MLVNVAAQWHLPGLLSLERLWYHSQNHSKEGNCFSPGDPEDPQTILPAPRSPPFLLTGGLPSLSVMALAMAWTCKAIVCTMLLIRISGGQPLSFSQPVVSGKRFSCAVPCAFFHSFFLSLSGSSLHHQGSLPFAAPAVLFPTKSTLWSSYLPLCSILPPPLLQLCSLSAQIDIFVVQNDFIFI